MAITEDQKRLYKSGVDAGFKVLDARVYFRDNMPEQPRREQTLETPWIWNNMPIFAYTDTDARMRSRSGKYNLFTTDLSEFYVRDEHDNLHNLDDVSPEGVQTVLTNKFNGSRVRALEAHAQAKAFASISSEYPHVAMYDEWLDLQAVSRGRFNGPPPKPEEYTTDYLPNIERQLTEPGQNFVGKITRPSQLNIAYESSPLYEGDIMTFDPSDPFWEEEFGEDAEWIAQMQAADAAGEFDFD